MHIYFNIRKTPSLREKINIHAYIINMHRITLNVHKVVLLQMVRTPYAYGCHKLF